MSLAASEFSMLVGLIYDTIRSIEAWQPTLDALCRSFGATDAVAIIAPNSDKKRGLSLIQGKRFVMTDDLNHFLPNDCPFASIAPLQVATVLDLVGEDRWRATEFYRAVSKGRDIDDVLSIEIALDEGSVYRLRFLRCDGMDRFGPREKKLAHALVPHLKRAFGLARERARDSVIHRRYGEACDRLGLGAIILDGKGHVHERNGAAARLLAGGDGLLLRGNRLQASDPTDDGKLQATIRRILKAGESVPGALLTLARANGTSLSLTIDRVVDVEALRAGASRPFAIVFVRDPDFRFEASIRAAKALYDLTPAEAALLVMLVNGRSLPEAAKEMGVQHTTVRTHLRSIFGKTGISRQSDLVRQVLNSVAALADHENDSFPVLH